MLSSVPVHKIILDHVVQEAGSLNYDVIGPSFKLLKHSLVPQLAGTRNTNSRVQHITMTPATLDCVPVRHEDIEKQLRAQICQLFDIPFAADLDTDEFKETELNLRIKTPLRDAKTGYETFQ